MERKVTIKIDPMGTPSIEGHNFTGQSCAEATKGIEAALAMGVGTVEREYKPEWNETEHHGVVQEIEH